MNDLLRSYKMILKRRQSIESEESQPLDSSHSSAVSFGTFQNQCVFHDTDTTDCELEISTKPISQIQTTPKSLLRRPFSYPSADIFPSTHDVYDRYHYLTKSSGILNDNSFIHSKFLSMHDEKLEPIKTQNSLVTIFAIWNTIMGSSLLAMAWGFEKSGLIPGILLHVFVAGICLYTAQIILKIGDNHGTYGNIGEVPELCKALLGKWAEVVAKIFSLIVLIGANIVYWILMSNFLFNSVDFIYGYIVAPNEIDNRTVICPKEELDRTGAVSLLTMVKPSNFYDIWDLYKTVPLFLALLMFPFLNFKSPTFFTKFNSLGAASVCYMIVFVIVKAYYWGIKEQNWIQELQIKPTFQALSGMLALSYFIHNIIISVMRSNRNQQHNGRDLSIAYCLVLFTYVFVGALFYVSFPMSKFCIEDNLLNNFSKHDPMTIVARLLLLFQLFTVYPLMCYMLRMDVFTNFKMLCNMQKDSEFSYVKVVILNIIIVTVCILFACFLPKIGTLIRYTGALSGMVYIFTLPSLLKMAALRNAKALTPIACIIHILIIVLGVLNFCLQFFITDV